MPVFSARTPSAGDVALFLAKLASSPLLFSGFSIQPFKHQLTSAAATLTKLLLAVLSLAALLGERLRISGELSVQDILGFCRHIKMIKRLRLGSS